MSILNLHRQDARTPDLPRLEAELDALHQTADVPAVRSGREWKELVRELLAFQAEDGGFPLLGAGPVESDCAVAFRHEPTYLCTALLLQAVLACPDSLGPDGMSALSRALHACCARRLRGHGYDALSSFLDATLLFARSGVREFLSRHGGLCPEFTALIADIREELRQRIRDGAFGGAWEGDCEEKILQADALLNGETLFVYGTLLQGQRNHDAFLRSAVCLGRGWANGFDLCDLGSFPGMVPGEGAVYGEVYRLTNADLGRIDVLEGEGSLYLRRPVTVHMETGGILEAEGYLFAGPADGLQKIHSPYNMNDPVWYVSYGSNMLRDRLRWYIQGGICPDNDKRYDGCTDRTMPVRSCSVALPFGMYYGNYGKSRSWKDSAVCFLDTSRPGRSVGRAWLISRQQLDQIHSQEGATPNWYPDIIPLGTIEGIPAFTFGKTQTGKKEPFSKVSEAYGNVLIRGLEDTVPGLTGEEARRYLLSCSGPGSAALPENFRPDFVL